MVMAPPTLQPTPRETFHRLPESALKIRTGKFLAAQVSDWVDGAQTAFSKNVLKTQWKGNRLSWNSLLTRAKANNNGKLATRWEEKHFSLEGNATRWEDKRCSAQKTTFTSEIVKNPQKAFAADNTIPLPFVDYTHDTQYDFGYLFYNVMSRSGYSFGGRECRNIMNSPKHADLAGSYTHQRFTTTIHLSGDYYLDIRVDVHSKSWHAVRLLSY